LTLDPINWLCGEVTSLDSHSLTANRESEPVIVPNELLPQLRFTKHHDWQFVITPDELWFYLSTDHEHLWLCPEEQPLEKPRHTIQDPKMTPTNAWDPFGFHLLGALPHGRTFQTEYYHDNILTALLLPAS
jgi:hypothetical protein